MAGSSRQIMPGLIGAAAAAIACVLKGRRDAKIKTVPLSPGSPLQDASGLPFTIQKINSCVDNPNAIRFPKRPHVAAVKRFSARRRVSGTSSGGFS